MSSDWVDGTVKQVAEQIRRRGDNSTKDIYVWSDGTVTGPRDNTDERVEELRLVGQFSPNETPDEDAIRETIRNGMREAKDSERDEERAVASGHRPPELPGTP
jgi:hypothetical protein